MRHNDTGAIVTSAARGVTPALVCTPVARGELQRVTLCGERHLGAGIPE
jgi:hypothetical protein